jgi:hypothetical protein
MPAIEIVKQRLWLAGQHQAVSLGYAIAPSCESHLRPFLEDGAVKMATENVLNSEPHAIRAESGARMFVAAMVIEARAMGLTELHEPTFFSAKTLFCPLWPFC